MKTLKTILTLLVLSTAFVATAPLSSIEKEEKPDLELSEISIIKTLVDPSTISEIIKKCYAFDCPVSSSILSVGINDIYLVETDNSKYVLRLSRVDKYLTMTNSEFLFELEWLDFLNQHHIPVSYPIRRLDNRLCGLIHAPEGPRYASLFSYAEGTTEMNVERAFILGKSLAQLHIVSDSFETTLDRPLLDLNHLIHLPVQKLKEHFKAINQEKCAFFDELASELFQQISALESTEGSFGIIAGDIHGYNQHFAADNQITMFDFEFCAYGYRLYDIATFRWSRGSSQIELWHAFLNGYQSVRTLTCSEIQAIDAFVKARNLWWMAWLLTLPEYQYKWDKQFWEQAFARFYPENP